MCGAGTWGFGFLNSRSKTSSVQSIFLPSISRYPAKIANGDVFCCRLGKVILNFGIQKPESNETIELRCGACNGVQPKHLKLAAELKDSRAFPASPALAEGAPILPAKTSALEACTEGRSSFSKNPLSS